MYLYLFTSTAWKFIFTVCSTAYRQHCASGGTVDPHAGLFGRGGFLVNDPHGKLTHCLY